MNGPSWRQCTAYLCLQPYCTTAAGLRHHTPATAAAAPGGIVLSASALRVFRRRQLSQVLAIASRLIAPSSTCIPGYPSSLGRLTAPR
eukprot:COSAG06_NODE_4186_length_4494_cov_1.972469_3_plen_88_part_00